MSTEWFYKDFAGVRGPYTTLEFKKLAQDKVINLDTLIRTDSHTSWSRARSVANLFPIAKTTGQEVPSIVLPASPSGTQASDVPESKSGEVSNLASTANTPSNTVIWTLVALVVWGLVIWQLIPFGQSADGKRVTSERASPAKIIAAPAPVDTPKGVDNRTPFLIRVDNAEFDERVRIWADQFGRPESWVRRVVAATDSAEEANKKLARARLSESW